MLRLPPLVLLCVVLTGCDRSRSYLNVFEEQRAAWDEAAKVLAQIQDPRDLPTAAPALETAMQKFEAIARRRQALPQPPHEVLERLEEERPGMEQSARRFKNELERVRALPGGEAFLQQIESEHQGLLRAQP